MGPRRYEVCNSAGTPDGSADHPPQVPSRRRSKVVLHPGWLLGIERLAHQEIIERNRTESDPNHKVERHGVRARGIGPAHGVRDKGIETTHEQASDEAEPQASPRHRLRVLLAKPVSRCVTDDRRYYQGDAPKKHPGIALRRQEIAAHRA